jgi:hypothetical protein
MSVSPPDRMSVSPPDRMSVSPPDRMSVALQPGPVPSSKIRHAWQLAGLGRNRLAASFPLPAQHPNRCLTRRSQCGSAPTRQSRLQHGNMRTSVRYTKFHFRECGVSGHLARAVSVPISKGGSIIGVVPYTRRQGCFRCVPSRPAASARDDPRHFPPTDHDPRLSDWLDSGHLTD